MSRWGLGAATEGWFESNFAQPTQVQSQGWPRIAAGESVLLLAPTGSGKTLAAFLASLSRLFEQPEVEPKTRILYISPLKALVYDIERNLRAPLAGIAHYMERRGISLQRRPVVSIRTGDTPARERQRQLRSAGEILVTTPESLYMMLGSQMSRHLSHVQTVIVDEIHSLAPTKRGAHLSLSLERLSQICEQDPQRIGLSATVEPVEAVARYLGGIRPVSIVNTLEPPKIDLQIVVPVEDMENPSSGGVSGEAAAPLRSGSGGVSILGQMAAEEKLRQAGGMGHGMAAEGAGTLWSSVYPKILELISQHQSTIIFVNSRGLCERLALRLNELAGEEVARSHHGSVSHKEREQIEEMLKAGQLRSLVATSSLELGIDMGAVDLVIMVESPGSVARGLQRIGRAGHGVGEVSQGRIFPKFRGDLLECTVVAQLMRRGQLEPLRMPENPLDVLAQQIVAMVSLRDWSVSELESVILKSANYRRLSSDVLREVLDMLSGRYPSQDFADLKPRLTWERDQDMLTARKGSRTLALVNGGTIPDRGLYRVVLGPGGPRVGELDEEMVHEIRAGQNFLLGATTWRVEEITRDTVYVSSAPGEPGRMPFWRGEGPGRPVELGRAIGSFLAQAGAGLTTTALEAEWGLDSWAAGNLLSYLREQKEATGTLPTDRSITVERFRDELGDWRVCVLSTFGSRVHAPWALALEAGLSARVGFEIQTLWTDDGIVLRFADTDEAPDIPELALDPDEVDELVLQQLANSSLFAAQFRENAGRALLLPRKSPEQRTPLWAQRLRAQNLLAVARQFPSFPILLETYRTCLQDIFDLTSLKELLRDIRSRKIRIHEVETASPSPFARSLVFSYVATYLYQGDAPLAERKAQALTLDRQMLSELLGNDELRDLLDAQVLAELEEELQGLSPERQARHPDDLHNLLRRIGDLTESEVELRCQGGDWLSPLLKARRAVTLQVAGERRVVAVEDVALYRDGLGAVPPSGLPAVFLETLPAPLESLLQRYARCHGPFVAAEAARRFGLASGVVEPVLNLLVHRQVLERGDFRPGGREREYCYPEVLRRWRRRTLAKLRGQVAPVESSALARFLTRWQTSPIRLRDAVSQLEGLPLIFSELEKCILPARVPGFLPRHLDELGQMGEIVWVGCGSLGNRDGRIALYRRERAALLLEPPDIGPLSGAHQAILQFLRDRGACFLMEIRAALRQDFSSEHLEEALEDLIWSGHVTNDLFAPLRTTRGPRTPRLGGRWVPTQSLFMGPSPTPTQSQLARVQSLLDRYGLICREIVQSEGIRGGYASLYPVLRAMEEAGKIRRGYFVEGLSANQFALAGAIDQLRQPYEGDQEVATSVLAATDPANPYGALLPWGESVGRPRRIGGARVILVEGRLAAFLDKGYRRLVTYPPFHEERTAIWAARALSTLAETARGRCLRIFEIDGQPALQSPAVPVLRQAGFRLDLDSLMLLASPIR